VHLSYAEARYNCLTLSNKAPIIKKCANAAGVDDGLNCCTHTS
jgi:hypothetical protein